MEAIHGGIDGYEVGNSRCDSARILDLCANLAPQPPPLAVQESLRSCSARTYPDPQYRKLRSALGRTLKVSEESLLPGNGAMELIYLTAQTFLRAGSRVAVLGPTFGEYERASRLMGAEITHFNAGPDTEFAWDLPVVAAQIRDLQPDILFVCNPNNPTGRYLGRYEVAMLRDAMTTGLLVLDEVYVDFVEDAWSSIDWIREGRIVILRSFTKTLALPGVRVGYAIGHPDVIGAVRRRQPPWSVNGFAEAIALAGVASHDHVQSVRATVARGKRKLMDGLISLGFAVVKGAANFMLVKVFGAREFRWRLARQGILVRDCESFGLPDHLRIAVPPPDEIRRVLTAFSLVRRGRPLDSAGSTF